MIVRRIAFRSRGAPAWLRRLPARTRAAVPMVVVAALLAATAGDGVSATADRTATRARDAAATARPERLRFRATWNELPVADAELLVQPAPDGTVVLRGRAETNEVLDLLWRMRDSFDAIAGVDPIRPRRFVLRQNENDRRRETTIVADGPSLVGTVVRRHHPARRAVVPLSPRLHDPASVAYAIRALPSDGTAATSYDVLAGTKVYTITVTPAGKGTVEAAGRRWPARRFRLALDLTPRDVESAPAAAPPSLSPVDARAPVTHEPARRESDIQQAELWISAGPERVPLRMQSQTYWGVVTVELAGRG